MAPFIKIPKTSSKPADPNAPSFLTVLPPELRNACYEVLFKHEEPVLVHNASAYHAIEPERYSKVYEAEIGNDAEFRHHFHLALPLLRSCRQVYHESAGIFYGSNEFLISRSLGRHDLDFDGLHYEAAYTQLHYASQWLSGLGSQSSFLTKIVLDVDAICPAECDDGYGAFDLLSIIRFLWFRANSQCSLTFAHTGRILSIHEADSYTMDASAGMRADVLNNIIYSLTTHDMLSIKRFGDSNRLLHAMNVCPPGDCGTLCFRRNNRNYAHSEAFEIMDHGRVLRLRHDIKEGSSLKRLPNHLQTKIFGHAATGPSAVIFDLDHRTVRGLHMNVFQVDKNIRQLSSLPLGQTQCFDSVIIRATANELDTDFNEFAALQDLLPRVEHVWRSREVFRDIILNSSHQEMKIALHIQTNTRAILEQVRIDIQGLMVLNHHFRLGNKATLQITLSYTDGNGTYEETASVSFSDLLKCTFLLLSDVLITWPNDLRPGVCRLSPSLWINGRGALLEASYPATAINSGFSVPNRHIQLREEEVLTVAIEW